MRHCVADETLGGVSRYRWRTWIRKHTPHAIADHVPKGKKDCGAHDWYKSTDLVDHCYHCDAERHHEPR